MEKNPKKWFRKVGDTPIVPLSLKIMAAFVVLLLISTFSTNYLNLVLNQRELVKKTNELLVKELKDVYTFSSNQFDIFQFSGDRPGALKAIETSASRDLKMPNSCAFGLVDDGSVIFQASVGDPIVRFPDAKILEAMNADRAAGKTEGSIHYQGSNGEYFGVYKYLDKWDCYIVRAELYSDMIASTNRIFIYVAILILALVVVFLVIGVVCINHILRFVGRFADSMIEMQESQGLGVIDLTGAPNDDITYLGASFNSLSVTINNLMGIFRKFVTQDVVERAYLEHNIKLEGKQMELSILFSDIRGFTYMTETLGNDIIDLLNVHYDRAIRCIHDQNGIVGSIIGDAVLAVYGTLKQTKNKSLESLQSAYAIQSVTASLREEMKLQRAEIEKRRALTESEERVFKAVLISVGVGIDGGTVFYGNIGSMERMTNTVIGDNVNSASRLEGLTRVYSLPVICSEYIRDEVLRDSDGYRFIEIDMVQVKGKTEGKRIFYPLDTKIVSEETIAQFDAYSEGLKLYYDGDWKAARAAFRRSGLELCSVFYDRIGDTDRAPDGWRGVWTMTTK
jgi:class 3 adenylate cyclase